VLKTIHLTLSYLKKVASSWPLKSKRDQARTKKCQKLLRNSKCLGNKTEKFTLLSKSRRRWKSLRPKETRRWTLICPNSRLTTPELEKIRSSRLNFWRFKKEEKNFKWSLKEVSRKRMMKWKRSLPSWKPTTLRSNHL